MTTPTSFFSSPPLPPSPPTAWPDPPASPLPPPPARPPVGLQNLLLSLGAGLVAVAVAVFTAVNWDRMGATLQGLVLVALTMVAGSLTVVAARRTMPATAEAVGLVALLMALGDVHAFRVGLAPQVDASLFWAGGLAVVSAAGWMLGTATGIRSTRIVVALTAQLPLLIALAGTHADLRVQVVALALQAGVVALVAARTPSVPQWSRIVGVLWAAPVVAVTTLVAVVDQGVGDPGVAWVGPLALALAVALALEVAVLWSTSETVRELALAMASLLGLGMVFSAAVEQAGAQTALAVTALAAALATVGALRAPARWGQVPAIVCGSGTALASLPLLSVMADLLVAASEVPTRAWDLPSAARASSFRLTGHLEITDAQLGLHLGAAFAVVLGAGQRLARSGRQVVLAVAALTGLVVAPALVPVSVAGATFMGIVLAMLAVGAAAWQRHDDTARWTAVSATVVALGWALAWGCATEALTLAVLGSSIAAALVLNWVALDLDDEALGFAAASSLAIVLPLTAGIAAVVNEASAPLAWAIAGVVGAVVSVLGVLAFDADGQTSGVRASLVLAIDVASVLVHAAVLVAVAGTTDVGALSIVLGAGAIGFGLHAARPARRPTLAVAAMEALVLLWLQLGHANVVVVEAYTLPLAVFLAGVGVAVEVQGRRSDTPVASWISMGPALLVALAPTVALVLTDVGGVRPVVGLVAGAAVLVAGAITGRRAPVDIGTVAVVVLGGRQLAPVVSDLPNWAAIGMTGFALLAVGARFEQRRDDVRAARRRYSALR